MIDTSFHSEVEEKSICQIFADRTLCDEVRKSRLCSNQQQNIFSILTPSWIINEDITNYGVWLFIINITFLFTVGV